MTEGEIPAAMADRVAQARTALIEMVAEADEQLMDAFFANGTLSQEQLTAGLRAATAAGKLFPLVCTSGLRAIGAQPLLDAHRDAGALARRARLRRRSTPTDEPATAARPATARPTRRSCGRRLPIRSPAASRCCGSSAAR